MRAYSNDLRERIVAAVEQGEFSIRQIAELFSVSLSCIVRLLQHKQQTGSVQPKPHAGVPKRKLDAAAEARLLELGGLASVSLLNLSTGRVAEAVRSIHFQSSVMNEPFWTGGYANWMELKSEFRFTAITLRIPG